MDNNTKKLDVVAFKRELDALIKENDRLNIIKTNYIQYAITLKSMGETLIKLAKEIDPVQTMTKNKVRILKKEYIKEFYNLLLNGTQITRKLIEATYPELDDSDLNYILTAIGLLPHVDKVKDGQCVRLFLR